MAALALISCLVLASGMASGRWSGVASPGNTVTNNAADVIRLQKKFDEAHDAVHRAKALAQLGEAQVRDAADRIVGRDYEGALAELRLYRDEVAAVEKELAATGVNPEKKPAGYRELQVSVRENLRLLEDIAFTAPPSQQSALVEIHEQLGQQNEKLLAALFPSESGPPAGTTPKPGTRSNHP